MRWKNRMRQPARRRHGAGGVVRVVAKSGPDGTAAVRKGLGAPGRAKAPRLARAVPARGAARFGAVRAGGAARPVDGGCERLHRERFALAVRANYLRCRL